MFGAGGDSQAVMMQQQGKQSVTMKDSSAMESTSCT